MALLSFLLRFYVPFRGLGLSSSSVKMNSVRIEMIWRVFHHSSKTWPTTWSNHQAVTDTLTLLNNSRSFFSCLEAKKSSSFFVLIFREVFQVCRHYWICTTRRESSWSKVSSASMLWGISSNQWMSSMRLLLRIAQELSRRCATIVNQILLSDSVLHSSAMVFHNSHRSITSRSTISRTHLKLDNALLCWIYMLFRRLGLTLNHRHRSSYLHTVQTISMRLIIYSVAGWKSLRSRYSEECVLSVIQPTATHDTYARCAS